MRRYRHLSAEERDRIAEMHARHEGVSAIAAAIGRNKSTVSREIARNGRNGRYGAIAAQSRSDARRKACRPRKRLSDPALAAEVRRRIVDDRRSPEQIDGRSRLERGGRCVVSFSTIYRGLATLMWTVPGGALETGGPYMRDPRHPRHFTDEFKRQIVDLYNAGKPKREIMDEYDLGKSTVERWIKSINATGSPRAADNRTPEQNRILELERENRRLRMEVDVLKQAALIYARK